MGKTSIQWTDETWNPVRGCTKISRGCKNCYAATFAERFRGVPGHPYEQGFDLRLVPDKLDAPLHWTKPRMVFVNSMSDLFHEDVPDEFIAAVFGVMAACPQHTFQILTKRAERLPTWFAWLDVQARKLRGSRLTVCVMIANSVREKAFVGVTEALRQRIARDEWPLPNVWLGVSVEDRAHGLPRVEFLRHVPAAVRMLSVEPLLEDLGALDLRGIDWVIVGGESGAGARPFDIAWARSIAKQCKDAGVAVFVKQLGAYPVMPVAAGPRVRMQLRDGRHGGDPAEWPEDLRVRQFPAPSNPKELR